MGRGTAKWEAFSSESEVTTYLQKYLELAVFAQVLTSVLQACTLVYLAHECNGTTHMSKAKHV